MSDDMDWVQAALRGDWEAFGAIVRKYANVLHAVAYEVVRDYHAAQDITQETILKAYMNMHTLQKPEKLGRLRCSILMEENGLEYRIFIWLKHMMNNAWPL